ncbi:hypothetical protein [Streptomyces himalayensis]|uniref:Uncharacterized protein n=1 Tax=Streptomyces himalayensis subsp. himalayensis TaxID=2756131 RepID=A0A7W0DMY3_9ACTN|nr:hypothetical protein [Streptomyces himalayensis]MBA2947965.1 hypothetical protein [Streptomyces himalayensis subsp. himalayensis]
MTVHLPPGPAGTGQSSSSRAHPAVDGEAGGQEKIRFWIASVLIAGGKADGER